MQTGEEESSAGKVAQQAMSFAGHMLFALLSWAALMAVGYVIQPAHVSQNVILLLSIVFPLAVGFLINHFGQSEMAPDVWLMGLIWILIVALHVLDMPTGPNACFQCGAAEKLARTFFSLPSPSGLMDNDGPFLGTWPAVALMGYSIGARLALRRES